MATTTLFPPVIDTYLPLVDYNDEQKKIYFNFSVYNTSEDIEGIIFTIKDAETNQDVIKTTSGMQYTTNIKVSDNNKPYIQFKLTGNQEYNKTTKDGFDIELQQNRFYKVQLRFVGKGISIYETLDEMLNSETALSYFSEWSTVGLLRMISTPTLSVLELPTAVPINDINKIDTITATEFANLFTLTTSMSFFKEKKQGETVERVEDSKEEDTLK